MSVAGPTEIAVEKVRKKMMKREKLLKEKSLNGGFPPILFGLGEITIPTMMSHIGTRCNIYLVDHEGDPIICRKMNAIICSDPARIRANSGFCRVCMTPPEGRLR